MTVTPKGGVSMAVKTLLLAAILVSLVWHASGDAAGREIRFRSTCSGSGMSGVGNTNGDLIKAGMGFLACRSNLGRATSQGVGEAVLAGTATCPNGNPGLRMTVIPGTGHAFARFEKTGELLFSEITSETVCYDPSTRTHFKSGTTRFTGGTGRFAGATGETEFEATQWVLYVDEDGNGFAAQSVTSTGTIILDSEPRP
jgi:hypothetical protein